MARDPLDDKIDRLYQLPLDDFTAARNALAKEAGKQGPEVKRLEKPNLAAWAMNQLYWQERKTYDDLIAAAGRLRAAHRQQLAGKGGDLRGVESAHRDAIRKATQVAREILETGGAAISDPVMTAVAETLDALPGGHPPGRLTKPLKRSGFEALQGFAVSATAKPVRPKVEPPKKKEAKPAEPPSREQAMTLERLRFAEAAVREAEAAFERTRRATERADRVVERLEGELAEAVTSVKDLRKEEAARKTAHDKAVSERDRLAKKL